MLRCEHPGFDSDERGARDSNAIPCPSRSPIPASKPEPSILHKSGTFYFALTQNWFWSEFGTSVIKPTLGRPAKGVYLRRPDRPLRNP